MIGDLQRAAMAEDRVRIPLTSRAMLNIKGIPLIDGEDPSTNPNLRYTNFDYYVKFKPRTEEKWFNRCFVLVADVLPGGKIRFTNWDNLKEISKKNIYLKWLIKNTSLSEDLIQEAAENLELPLRCIFDQVAYSKKLKEQIYKETGVYPHYSMFRDPLIAKAERLRYETYLENKRKGAGKQV